LKVAKALSRVETPPMFVREDSGRTRRLGFRLLANELARRESLDPARRIRS
jgi:hypothetical protein